MTRKFIFLSALIALLATLGVVRPSFAYDRSLGGVNLTAYCSVTYGNTFKSLTLGPGAGDWVCQNGSDIHDRRPISVQTACMEQYPQYSAVVKSHSGVGAGSWVCDVAYAERGVNLTAYCERTFGNDYRALLIGSTSGDWVCQRGQDTHDRRPISVNDACKEEYSGVWKSLAVPPSGWECLIGPA
jgi:hypothetical protein